MHCKCIFVTGQEETTTVETTPVTEKPRTTIAAGMGLMSLEGSRHHVTFRD